MSIGDRLKYIRKTVIKMSQQDFAKAICVSQGTLSDLEKNKGKPSVDTVISASRYSGLSTDWILFGEERTLTRPDPLFNELSTIYSDLSKAGHNNLLLYAKFLLTQHHSNIDSQSMEQKACYYTDTSKERNVYIPILGTAAAGRPIMTEELVEGFLPVPAKFIKKNTYVIRARGDSMTEAGIRSGDLVIIKPQPTVENGEMALIQIAGESTIKYFYREGNHVRLKPGNHTMDDIVITDLSTIKVLGKAIKTIPREEAEGLIKGDFNGDN